MKIDPKQIEEAAKELYIRALKLLPPDIKQGFSGLAAHESDATAKSVLGTMITNIKVAEDTDNLLCQDTGIPIYNVWIGSGVESTESSSRTRSGAAASAPPASTRCARRWCTRSPAPTSIRPAAAACR